MYVYTNIFDGRVAETPRWSGLYHFNEITTAGEFTDGRKYEDMSKVFLHVIVVFGD